jgi:ABC-2 type transport system permease protein
MLEIRELQKTYPGGVRPQVNLAAQGLRASLGQFTAALGVEFRLLRAERSLVVIAPLMMVLCGLELAAYRVVPEISYSAAYAGRTANTLLLFLFGVAIFYTGESSNRDREARVEPVLWSLPAPNFVLLISKFTATLLLSVFLIALAGLTAVGVQLFQGHAPLELEQYLTTYVLILIPSVVFMIAAAVALNVLLRDKYLTYALSLALGGGLYYLAGLGYKHWLYNPVLYQLWTPSDLVGGGSQFTRILIHRVYCGALSALLLALALLLFERKSTRGRTILVALSALLIAAITGFIINAGA